MTRSDLDALSAAGHRIAAALATVEDEGQRFEDVVAVWYVGAGYYC